MNANRISGRGPRSTALIAVASVQAQPYYASGFADLFYPVGSHRFVDIDPGFITPGDCLV